jgi:hypothetical protein
MQEGTIIPAERKKSMGIHITSTREIERMVSIHNHIIGMFVGVREIKATTNILPT